MRDTAGRSSQMRLGALAALPLALALLGPAPAAAQEGPDTGDAAATQSADRVISGDHTVAPGEVVADIAVVGGTLTVRGEVTGNAVVVGGDLVLGDGGLVGGDATVTGGRIVHEGGRVRGEMKMLDGGAEAAGAAAGAAGTAEAARSAAERQRSSVEERMERLERMQRRASSGPSWFTPIRRGLASLISTLAFGLVVAGIGALLVFYGRPYLETVSDTLRSSTARSGAVGLAAGVLILPAFVVMVVALAVSIIGIPLLLVAVPLYPLAIAAALAMGLLAGAHAIGERTAEQQGPIFERRWSNSYAYLFTGLAMLITPLVAASLFEMTGFLGFIGTLLTVVTWVAIWAVTTAGFGAVILSRAGTRRTFVAPPPDLSMEPDPLFDDEPSPRAPHA